MNNPVSWKTQWPVDSKHGYRCPVAEANFGYREKKRSEIWSCGGLAGLPLHATRHLRLCRLPSDAYSFGKREACPGVYGKLPVPCPTAQVQTWPKMTDPNETWRKMLRMKMAHVTVTCFISVAWLEDLMMLVMPAIRCLPRSNQRVSSISIKKTL